MKQRFLIYQTIQYTYIHLTDLIYNLFYISITFDNAIKACFYNKKYTVSIKTRMTQIENCPEIEVNFLL